MNYDSNMTKGQIKELLKEIRNGERPDGVCYGYGKSKNIFNDIESVVNNRLQELDEWNYYEGKEFFEKETMKINILVPIVFAKCLDGFYLIDIFNYIVKELENKSKPKKYYKRIYLDHIIEMLDNKFGEDGSFRKYITEDMLEAEKDLYYTKDTAGEDFIKRNYKFSCYKKVGKIKVKTADYAYEGYKHLIKGASYKIE